MSTAGPDAVSEAVAAFLYGYPLEYCLRELARLPAGTASAMPGVTPLNTFGYAHDLLGPSTHFVSPNNDTVYLMAPCDLTGGPLVLHVPDTAGRYYVLQFVDAWTNNFAYVGRRATGTEERRFLLVGPEDGDVDAGADLEVIQAPTNLLVIVGRLQVDGPDDLDAARNLAAGFTLHPLTPDSARTAAGLPEPDPRVPAELAFWEAFRVDLAACPPPPQEAGRLDRLAQLGLTSVESPYVDPAPELAQLLVQAEDAGRKTIEDLMSGQPTSPTGWTTAMHIFDYNRYALGLGTLDTPAWRIDDDTRAVAARAVAARAGLWGNHGYEAAYFLSFVDADGAPLDGAHQYTLRLPAPPPVDAFWSLTMYGVPDFYLVDNPIDRYSIGDRTPGLVTADDGSITLYLQSDRPVEDDAAANWLPTPSGRFRPIFRLYQPRQPAIDGTYQLPPITRSV
ncbi:DUF1254 domain-containing protein [Microlunatus ginsengisoli]|uniref:DUF1254 domain-containing protein n=1 Tax=Microlunatus ginsengisoli TaxID=363863 RepID=A0ABP7ATW7_9ACTN